MNRKLEIIQKKKAVCKYIYGEVDCIPYIDIPTFIVMQSKQVASWANKQKKLIMLTVDSIKWKTYGTG